jgi:hypothetical protein
MAETMPLGGTVMVEAVSVMGRVHLSWNRGGDADAGTSPDTTAGRSYKYGSHPIKLVKSE